MAESLKQKTISGMIWNAIERFGSSFFLFVSNLVLARLLSPDDFGCIGMLTVFISISAAIVDGGFGSALIQKKNPSKADYSTVFFWNLFLALILYIILYLSATAVAKFYKIPSLSDLLKVLGVIVIINSFTLIQQNILKKQIAFKKLAKMNLGAIIAGTCVGILFAFLGYGVWSLVIKTLVTGIVQCVVYWLSNHWRPQWVFSWTAFRSLFKFGSFMFLTSITNTLYQNIVSLIIGKSFSAAVLGYFTQARKLEDVTRQSLSSVVNNVTFPVFSQIQDDKAKLREATRKSLKLLAFINFSIMTLLIVIAKPLFVFLFTEKWNQSIPFFQMICISGFIDIANSLNHNLIASLGKSHMLLSVRSIQQTVAISLMLLGLIGGLWGLVLGYVFSSYTNFIIASIATGKLLNYNLLHQLKDIMPSFVIASIVGTILFFALKFMPINNNIMQICIISAIYFLLYVGIHKILNIESFNYVLQIITENRNHEKESKRDTGN